MFWFRLSTSARLRLVEILSTSRSQLFGSRVMRRRTWPAVTFKNCVCPDARLKTMNESSKNFQRKSALEANSHRTLS